MPIIGNPPNVEDKSRKSEYNRRYYEDNREKRKAYMKAYRLQNRDKITNKRRSDRLANREKKLEYSLANQEKKIADRLVNKEMKLEGKIERYLTRREKRKNRVDPLASAIARNHKRRAIKNSTIINRLTAAQWQAIKDKSTHCHWCKTPWSKRVKMTLDHVIPLSRGGVHSLDNVVAACERCNFSKGAKLINPITGQGILL